MVQNPKLAALRKKAMKETKSRVSEQLTSRDQTIVQCIRALEECEVIYNQVVSRARGWYSLYFPELNKAVMNHSFYLSLVRDFQSREKFTEAALSKVTSTPDQAKRIASLAKNSMGGELREIDVGQIVSYVDMCQDVQEELDKMNDYLDNTMREVAPNLNVVAGSKLGAKLIAHAGSLKRLAMLPSSTIQIMGAEKALFKHMKTGVKGPKHGLIFQHPLVSASIKEQRGKLARALAAKISLAVKEDYFNEGKKDVSKMIMTDLDAKVKEIRSN
ncbi:MAG: hypothetical protein GOV15_04820 [Candidatus Diapherotrites archaeon]|nr:hypothetical protein [Candidatus Diapherotrites archaeon]